MISFFLGRTSGRHAARRGRALRRGVVVCGLFVLGALSWVMLAVWLPLGLLLLLWLAWRVAREVRLQWIRAPSRGTGSLQAAIQRGETPVFFDHDGRRWKTLRALALLVIALAVAASIRIVPTELRHEPLLAYNPATTSAQPRLGSYDPHLAPYELADRLGVSELAVIGESNGPFAEVVHLARKGPSIQATPLYHQGIVYPLDAADIAAVGNSAYAILRYGRLPSRELAVTFDDGPDPHLTPAILDLLAREHAPASFFESGSAVAKNSAIAKREVKEGHLIGSRGLDQVDFNYISQMRADQELNQAQRVIRATTGTRTSFIRLPASGDDPQGSQAAALPRLRLAADLPGADDPEHHRGDGER